MILTACTGFPPGLPDLPVLIVTYDKQTLARALANHQPSALNPGWTQSPVFPMARHSRSMRSAGRWSAAEQRLRKADDQGHPQGDGDAEPQIVHSHHLRFGCAAMDAKIDGGLLSGFSNKHKKG